MVVVAVVAAVEVSLIVIITVPVVLVEAVVVVEVEAVLVLGILGAVVVSALIWAGRTIGTFVKVKTVDILVEVLVDVLVGVPIIVSEVAVDLLMVGLTGKMFGVGVDVLVGVNIKVFSGEMTAFEFAMSGPLE